MGQAGHKLLFIILLNGPNDLTHSPMAGKPSSCTEGRKQLRNLYPTPPAPALSSECRVEGSGGAQAPSPTTSISLNIHPSGQSRPHPYVLGQFRPVQEPRKGWGLGSGLKGAQRACVYICVRACTCMCVCTCVPGCFPLEGEEGWGGGEREGRKRNCKAERHLRGWGGRAGGGKEV